MKLFERIKEVLRNDLFFFIGLIGIIIISISLLIIMIGSSIIGISISISIIRIFVFVSFFFSFFFSFFISFFIIKYLSERKEQISTTDFLKSEIEELKKKENEENKEKIRVLEERINIYHTNEQEKKLFNIRISAVERELTGGNAKNKKLLITEWGLVVFLGVLIAAALFALAVVGYQEYEDYQNFRKVVSKTYNIASTQKSINPEWYYQGHIITVFCFMVFLVAINLLNRRLKEINQHNQQSQNIDNKISALRALNVYSDDENEKDNAVKELLNSLLKKEDLLIANKEENKTDEVGDRTFLEKIIERVLNSKHGI